jgi:phosphate transport system substrate-binding protein
MWQKILIFVLILSLKVFGVQAQDKSTDLAIVVNKNRAIDNLTSEELKKIFRAEKTVSADGVHFIIFARETGSPERAAVLANLYGMTEADYAKYFLQATFIGQVAAAPRELSSAGAVRQYVSRVGGGIGYISASDVDESVKVVKIDGKLPGDPDYKLKIK